MNLDKLVLIKDAAYTVFHATKGVETATKLSADDTATTKGRKIANSIKHISMAIERGLSLRGR